MKIEVKPYSMGDPTPGIAVDVEVTEKGIFTAAFQGEHFEANSLEGLRRQLRTVLLASRVEVPFVSRDGQFGIARGYHAGTRKLLVTWENGAKDRISTHERVYRELPAETLSELRGLHAEAERIHARVREIQADMVPVVEIFNEALGSNVEELAHA